MDIKVANNISARLYRFNPISYFVCNIKCSDNDPEGCCSNVGALEIFQTFEPEIDRLHLGDRVEVRKSGCLDQCVSGAVVMICRLHRNDLSWLPTKIRVKLRKLFLTNRHFYGNLTKDSVQAIAESHLVKGKPLKNVKFSLDRCNKPDIC